MSKYLFGLLLAGAAAPALAAGGPHDRHHGDDNSPRQESHSERPARSGGNEARPQPDRSQHAERPQASGERPQFAGRPQFVNRPQVSGERPQFAGRPQVEADSRQSNGETPHARPVMRENPYAQQSDSVRNWRPREQAVQPNGYYQQRGDRANGGAYNGDGQRRVSSHGTRGGYVAGVPRQGTQPPVRFQGHRNSGSHWNTNWRNDRRYDWRDRRRHNRSLFHIGLYSDPFGWGYQSFSIGWRLWPNYYQQSYWIDPAMYGLPYPPAGMQWVRYYNDALLVDTFSGEVVDEIPGFFF